MFEKARLKLTAWYLFIIMLISISFSIGMYRVLTNELDRVERMQRLRLDLRFDDPFTQRRPSIDPELLSETQNRIKAILVLINLGIFAASSLAGYFLAGKTLRPIKQMVDEQNRFITDSSHELRTPLTALKSEIEVNLRDEKLSLNEAKKLLESNLEEVNKLQYLSDNLIKLTQFQENGSQLVLKKVSLREVAKEAILKVQKLAKRKKILIKNEIKDLSLPADKQTLVELFVILLDNGIKYSPEKTDITIKSIKTDHFVQIKITDQGIGIEEADLPNLFDRFYRADKSRTKAGVPGYGLGLSIAKQIVDRHSGYISVESKPDKGTTFYIKLPLRLES